MNCSPSGPYVHGILQTRIWEWVAILFSRGSSWPRDWIWVSCIAARFFTTEPPSKSLDYKEIKPVNPKGNQPWILIGRTNAEAEAPIFWSPDANSRLMGKDFNAGKDWGQKEKRAAEDEVVGCHHRLNGHKLGQTQEMVRDREAWHVAVPGLEKSQTWLGDWTTTTISKIFIPLLYNPDIHPIYQTDYHLAFGKWENNWL